VDEAVNLASATGAGTHGDGDEHLRRTAR